MRRGSGLAMVDDPDEVEDHVPAACGGFGKELSTGDSVGYSHRQVRDIPLGDGHGDRASGASLPMSRMRPPNQRGHARHGGGCTVVVGAESACDGRLSADFPAPGVVKG